MNVEIGTEAAQFPEEEHIIGIFLAVRTLSTEKPTCMSISMLLDLDPAVS